MRPSGWALIIMTGVPLSGWDVYRGKAVRGHGEKVAPAGPGERPQGTAAGPTVRARTSSPQQGKKDVCRLLKPQPGAQCWPPQRARQLPHGRPGGDGPRHG